MEERYECLINCLKPAAEHHVVAYLMGTDSFLQALNRFTKRQGVPSNIYWNFVGTNEGRLLCNQSLKIKAKSVTPGIQWHLKPALPLLRWGTGTFDRTCSKNSAIIC